MVPYILALVDIDDEDCFVHVDIVVVALAQSLVFDSCWASLRNWPYNDCVELDGIALNR